MTAAWRFEWMRVRTIRSSYWLVGLALLLAALAAAGFALATREETLGNGMGAAIYTGGSAFIPLPFPPVFMAVLGILAVGHEYRHGTIQPTLQALPHRSALVGAKLLVVAVVSGFTAIVGLLLNGLVGALVRGEPIPLAGDEPWALLGYVVFVVLWGLLGAALALLLRSIPAAIVFILVAPLVVEPILQLLSISDGLSALRDVVPYLPFSAGQQLPQATDMGTGAGSRWAGGAAFAGFIAVVLAPAWALFEKRDA